MQKMWINFISFPRNSPDTLHGRLSFQPWSRFSPTHGWTHGWACLSVTSLKLHWKQPECWKWTIIHWPADGILLSFFYLYRIRNRKDISQAILKYMHICSPYSKFCIGLYDILLLQLSWLFTKISWMQTHHQGTPKYFQYKNNKERLQIKRLLTYEAE